MKRRLPLLLLATALAARAEQLPIRAYTTADGLPHDRIKRIAMDHDGFVWFCTLAGVSRFDGRDFVTLGVAEGLPVPSANDLVETSRGMWVATNGGGVAFFEPNAVSPRFHTVATGPDAASRVNVLARDAHGALWAGSDGGLFRLDDGLAWHAGAAFRPVPLGIPGREDASVGVWALLTMPSGLLVGTGRGLYLVDAAAPPRPVPLDDDGPALVFSLAAFADGRVLVGRGDGRGLVLLDPALRPLRRWGVADGLPNGVVTALLVKGDQVAIGTEGGIARLTADGIAAWGTREGLSTGYVSTLESDRDGGLWIGTPEGGAMRLQDSASMVYDERDGFGRITRFFPAPDGKVCGVGVGWRVSCFDGRRFAGATPRSLARYAPSSWRGYFGALRDREGGLWLATPRGVHRYAPTASIADLERAEPVAIYTAADGVATDAVSQILEDRNGDVWMGAFGPVRDPLTLWHRATGRFERFGAAAGLPAFGSPTVFGLDAAGNVWIAYRDGTLARHKEGRFQILSGRNGIPTALVTGFASDLSGRLWGTAEGAGLLRIDAPDAAEPRGVLYGPREGVTGNYPAGIVVDTAGKVVFGTDHDLMRCDPATGRIGKVLPDRVLLQSQPACAFRDREGALWFGTWRGTVRILPVEERAYPPPRVRIASVKVRGAAFPVAGSGAETVDLGEIAPTADLSIAFFALGAAGQPIAFSHLLEGVETTWSPAHDERSVHFAQFAPGRYRFRIRTSSAPAGEAAVSFRVPVPLWRRWWFLLGAAVLAAGAGYGANVLRMRHRLALEAVREQIASDLHDDLGAGLSRISILSEVAALALRSGGRAEEAVAKIMEASREVDERLADGIWTVDPTHDDLASLGQRLCLLATELLEPAGIAWRVEVPDEAKGVRLRPDRRRELYLLLKEAMANAARHSEARHLAVTFAAPRRRLAVTLSDDGRGFNETKVPAERLVGGHGLANMRARAAALGGTLALESVPGRGTTLRLDVPIPSDG